METPALLAGALEVGLAHAGKELRHVALELVGRAALGALALPRDGRIEVEEESRIRLQPGMHDLLEGELDLLREPAAAALVGVGRIAEAVANDPAPGGERGLDHERD